VKLRKTLQTVETTALWLFLLQAFRVLFSALFGVIYDAIFDQTLSLFIVGLDLLLLILATLSPLLLRRWENQARLQAGAALLVFVARVLLSVPNPTLQLYAAILLLGGAAFYIARLLWHEPARLTLGLVLGLGADQILRGLDYTFDPSLRSGALPLVAAASLVLALVSLYLARAPLPTTQTRPTLRVGLALGAALFVQTSFLALPNALSRWSGIGYAWIAPLLLLMTLLPLNPSLRAAWVYLSIELWPMGGLIYTIIAVLCLALAAWLGGVMSALALLLLQFLFVFVLTASVEKWRVEREAELRYPGLEMSLGLGLFILLNFAFAFTFTYPYTISWLRGLGTLVLFAGLLLALLPILNAPVAPEVQKINTRRSILYLGGIVVTCLICALFTYSPPVPTQAPGETLRLATYNIHYGFDSHWNFNLEDIARTIEAESIDVIVLQEVDAARITSLSVDDALWLGQRLDMHVVFQPTLERLSGIALLSRYPLQDSGGQWLSSELEQTAIVHGELEMGHSSLHVYGVWLGLESEERLNQLADALEYIGSQYLIALGGDFNATPDSPVYAHLRDIHLEDPFMTLGENPAPHTSPAINPDERIDYIWLRGLATQDAWVPDSTASDHRMVVVKVRLQ
jgi:endonuclease/exonuclease/phosphatase family metal-dependent hydrolase